MANIPLEINRGGNVLMEGDNYARAFERITLVKPGENYDSFTPGGGNGTIELPTNREALEITGAVKGWSATMLKTFNTPFGQRRKFTWLGALVDEYANDPASQVKQVEATCYGRLTFALDEDKRDAIGGVEFTVKSISKYVLRIGSDEIYRFNIELGGWIMEGQSQQIATAIGLQG